MFGDLFKLTQPVQFAFKLLFGLLDSVEFAIFSADYLVDLFRSSAYIKIGSID